MKTKHPKVAPTSQPTLFELRKPNEAFAPITAQEIARPFEIPGTRILLGTSSFTASGSFPPGGAFI